MKRYVVLENIRSAHNVGSIFRTSDGAGVSKLFLVGHTPAPIDRFGREQPEIEKTSLGAVESVDWEYCDSLNKCLKKLKREGVHIVAVEQANDAIDYRSHTPEEDTAYIFGNEVDGVSDEALREASCAICIPMRGNKESLNVAVAAGIILFADF